MQNPHKGNKVLADFQARGTVLSCPSSNVNLKKNAKYMQVFSDADTKFKNTMPYQNTVPLKWLLISCSGKRSWSFEQGNVMSIKIYPIHLTLLARSCITCERVNVKCVTPSQLPANSPSHAVLQ